MLDAGILRMNHALSERWGLASRISVSRALWLNTGRLPYVQFHFTRRLRDWPLSTTRPAPDLSLENVQLGSVDPSSTSTPNSVPRSVTVAVGVRITKG